MISIIGLTFHIFEFDLYISGNMKTSPKILAKAGTNISLACSGVTSSSSIYLLEWVCQGCSCAQCPSHPGNGLRILRYSGKITHWGNSFRRNLDKQRYSLEFAPVTVEDKGVYYCFINKQPDPSPVQVGPDKPLLGSDCVVPFGCAAEDVPEIPFEPGSEWDEDALNVEDAHNLAGNLSFGQLGWDKLVHIAKAGAVPREDQGVG